MQFRTRPMTDRIKRCWCMHSTMVCVTLRCVEKFTGWILAVHKPMAVAVRLLHYIGMLLAIIFVLKNKKPKVDYVQA